MSPLHGARSRARARHTYFNWGSPRGPWGDAGKDLEGHRWFACTGDGGKIDSDKGQFSASPGYTVQPCAS